MGDCVAPYPTGYQPITKTHPTSPSPPSFSHFAPNVSPFTIAIIYLSADQTTPDISPFSSTSFHLCHYVMSLCHHVMSYCHTYITNLIRIHLDNIYVNKLTMKQLTTTIVINICKLNYNCEHTSTEQYISTNNNNKTNYILLQTKYDM